MRFLLVETRLEKDPSSFHPHLIKLWKQTEDWGDPPHTRLKKIVESGYVDLFQIIFGQKGEILETECGKVFQDSLTSPKKTLKPLLNGKIWRH